MSNRTRKKKKSIWRSTFYRVYFALVALALVGIAIGTLWLQGVLADYESAQPKYVAGEVARLFEDADYDAIYPLDTSASQFTGGDRALYVDNLKQLTQGRDVAWTPAFSADKDERRYNVTLDGERFANFTLVPSGQVTRKGNRLWQLGSVTTLVELQTPEPTPSPTPEPQEQYLCVVTAPKGYAVKLDGVALSAENAQTSQKPMYEDGFLPAGVPSPVMVEYQYTSLNPEPALEATDETGAPAAVNPVADRERTWLCPMRSDENYAQQYGKAAIALGRQVAKFINKDASKRGIRRVCAANSPADTLFDNLSNRYTTPHTGISFRDETVSDVYVLTPNCFTCRVSFDTVLRTEKGDAVYPTAYTFCVIKDGEDGKLYNLQID